MVSSAEKSRKTTKSGRQSSQYLKNRLKKQIRQILILGNKNKTVVFVTSVLMTYEPYSIFKSLKTTIGNILTRKHFERK